VPLPPPRNPIRFSSPPCSRLRATDQLGCVCAAGTLPLERACGVWTCADDYTAEQLLYGDLVSGSPVLVLSGSVQLPPVQIFY
jgi:hypothetical protein